MMPDLVWPSATKRPPRGWATPLVAIGLVWWGCLGSAVVAQSTWTGSGTSNNWGNAANWTAPLANPINNSLIFTGTVQTSANNNVGGSGTTPRIVFTPTAGSFTLTGFFLNLSGSIANNAAGVVQTIRLPLGLTAATHVVNTVTGGTTILRSFLSGGNAAGSTSVSSTGGGVLVLSGSNSFTGNVSLNGGTLVLGHANALSSGTLRLFAPLPTVRADLDLTVPNGVSLHTGTVTFDGSNGLGFGDLTQNTSNRTIVNNVVPEKRLVFGGTTYLQESTAAVGRTLTLAGTGNTQFTGAIIDGGTAGSSGLTIASTGTTMLDAASTYTGTTTISGGVVEAGRASAFGAGPITFKGGMLRYTAGSDSENWGARIVESTSPITLDPNGRRVTVTGVDATNVAGLTVAGSGGTVVVDGTTAYVGPTTVTGGTLEVAGVISSTSQVTVASGGLLAGSGSIAGTTAIAGGATLSPGASLGTLSVGGDLSFNSGGNYNWQMLSATGTAGSASAWDLVSVGGALSIDSTAADPFRVNAWTLSGISPDVSGSAANFSSAGSYAWTIATAAGGITGFDAAKFRIVTSATNGTGGFANDFGSGTFSIAQSGNDLNLVFTSGGAPTVITIDVASGMQTQTQAGYPLLSGSTPVVKTGGGTLVLTAANTLTGSTTVQGGRLQLANGSALGSSMIVPVAGGTVTLADGLQTSVGGLLPNAGGLTDVGNGMVTVATGLSTAAMVNAIVSGMGDGTWNGASGITSTAAAASGGDRTIGWLDNGDGSVTFAFAAAGDTNLDWQVDIIDAANFLAGGKFDTGSPASWNEGDFTYDGVVDILDAASFLSNGLFDAGAYNPISGQAGAVAVVPEPSSWLAAMTACGCIGWLASRRRPFHRG